MDIPVVHFFYNQVKIRRDEIKGIIEIFQFFYTTPMKYMEFNWNITQNYEPAKSISE